MSIVTTMFKIILCMSMVSISFASVCNSVDPPKCLVYDNATDTCHAIDCWIQPYQGSMRTSRQGMVAGYDSSRCTANHYWSRLWKYRTWDIFLTFMLVFACPLILYCFFICCVIARDINMD